jgi:hypothetical protein
MNFKILSKSTIQFSKFLLSLRNLLKLNENEQKPNYFLNDPKKDIYEI